MRISLNWITFVLIFIIIYLAFYQIFPVYRQALQLVQDVNKKKVTLQSINEIKTALDNLQQDPVFQELLRNKDKLSAYLPDEPLVEGIVYDLLTVYRTLNLANFPGMSYSIKDSDLNVPLAVMKKPKLINFSFKDSMNYPTLLSIVKLIESNVRLMDFNALRVSKDERKGLLNVDFSANAYHLIK